MGVAFEEGKKAHQFSLNDDDAPLDFLGQNVVGDGQGEIEVGMEAIVR